MNDTSGDTANIFAALWRRKWLILCVALLAGVGTYEYYKHKSRTFKASTQLFVGGASEQSALSGEKKAGVGARALADQVGLINSPIIGKPAREALRRKGDTAAVHGKATATASATSDFITITGEAKNAEAASDLVNAYAQAFIRRQRSDYTRNLRAQIATARQQLLRIESSATTTTTTGKAKGAKGVPSSTSTLQAANLASKISQLESQLSTFAGVQQVGLAKPVALPANTSPKKNAIFGFVIGLILASGAAYLLDRLDRRVRLLADVESIFKTQILAALPSVRSPVVRPDGSRAPARSLLEPMRRLYTTLKLGDPLQHGGREHAPRVILFLSPNAGDGRSSVVANLARVQCEAGERVAVIEADFRRPSQARLLDLGGQYGLADVLTGRMPLEEAMQTAKSSADRGAGTATETAHAAGGVSTVVESARLGSLSALVGNGGVANPPALLAGEPMTDLLRSVSSEYDYVLIDVPPPPEVSDAMPLLEQVDGIVIVARIGHTREAAAERLAQILDRTLSAPVLGAVVNCVPRKEVEHYGFSVAPMPQRRRRLPRR